MLRFNPQSRGRDDAMLSFLFRRLTAEPARGEALFAAVTAEARRPSWYVEGAIPDTLDGRFAVLATITALALVRLEREGDPGDRASVALTERFIEVMESEHRELGLGDPTLGKTVRRLVGMLAGRTELLRNAGCNWKEVTRESLYKGDVAEEPLRRSAAALEQLARRLDATKLDELEQGEIG
jgi:cytochrome b pre-mRNA-processing protein 3